MFGFLKDKLKSALSKFTSKAEEAPEEEIEVEKEVKAPKKEDKKETPKQKQAPAKKAEDKPSKSKEKTKEIQKEAIKKEEAKVEPIKAEVLRVEPVKKEPPKVSEPIIVKEEPKVKPIIQEKVEQKSFFSRIKTAIVGETPKQEVKVEEKPVYKEEVKAPETEKGFFQKITEKITTKKITSEAFDELFWDLELAMLENNVAIEVIEKIKVDLKRELVDKPIPRGKVEEVVASSLHKSIEELFSVPTFDLISKAKQKKPLIVCFVGVNGSGKTTSIAKVTKYLQANNLSVVLAAADTFRAAAIDQLQLHADKLGVKLIRHDYGSDPAAVAFDAIKHAEAAKKDVVLIDTAGRLHSNVNLIDEMKKIMRVAKPDLKIFVGESITGNDCVEQARKFDEAVGIDGIILAKADIDEKGGAALSVSYVTKKPILFLGMGQEYKDLEPFDKDKLIASIGL